MGLVLTKEKNQFSTGKQLAESAQYDRMEEKINGAHKVLAIPVIKPLSMLARI